MPALNFWKITKGLNLNPTTSPSSPSNGDFYYDSGTNRFTGRMNGAFSSIPGIDTSDVLTNKTISGSSNTLSNIADGALSTSYIKADGSRALTAAWSTGDFQIKEGDGSASLPSFTFNSDNTTGAYLTAATYHIAVSGNSILEVGTTAGGTFLRSNSFDIRSSQSGGDNNFILRNQSNTANSGASIQAVVAGTSGGNPYFLSSDGTTQWSWGMDKGNSNRFSVSQNNTLGSNNYLLISTAGLVTLGASGGTQTHAINGNLSATGTLASTSSGTNSLTGKLQILRTLNSAFNVLDLRNQSNAATTNDCYINLQVGGTSAGNPYIAYTGGSQSWSVGPDQVNNSGNFIFQANGSLDGSTNKYLTISTAGTVALANNLNHTFNSSSYVFTSSNSGNSNSIQVINSSNTASSVAQVLARVAGTSAGNAYYRASVNGVQEWSFGVDNAASQAFKISASSTLGTNDYLTISTAGVATFSKMLDVGGGLSLTNTRTVTTTATVGANDTVIFCNQSGAFTLTLPTATDGRVLIIKDIAGNAATNNITVARAGSDTIDGATSLTINTNYASYTLVGKSGLWSIV